MLSGWKAYCLTWIVVFAVIYVVGRIAISSASADAKGSTTRGFLFVKAELVLLLFSVLIYKRVMALFEPQGAAKPDEYRQVTIASHVVRLTPYWKIAAVDFARALLLLFLLFTHACFLMYYVFVNEDPNWLALISFVSCAIYLHTLIFILIALAVEGLAAVLRISHEPTGVRRLMVDKHLHTLLALGLAVLLTFSGIVATTLPPGVRQVTVPIKNLPAELQGFKIALLTDLHIGPTVGRWRVQRIADITSKIEPDVVAIAGDLVDGTVHALKGAAAPLATIISKFGKFFVTGNHEYYHGNVENWFSYLNEIGVQPLHNEHKQIYPRNGSNRYLCLAGVDDLYAEKAHIPGHGMNAVKALAGCANNETVILLSHQPNAAKQILDSPLGSMIDLVLSGHTHGGQLYVFWPFAYFSNAFMHGLYTHAASGAHVYVSAGANFWGPPVKMFGLCEITLLELRRA